jgi:hypothetical protein
MGERRAAPHSTGPLIIPTARRYVSVRTTCDNEIRCLCDHQSFLGRTALIAAQGMPAALGLHARI